MDWGRYFTRRLGAVTAGVVLIAVPTFFTIFPDATKWEEDRRIAVAGAWVIIAIFGVRWGNSMADREIIARASTGNGEVVVYHDDVLPSATHAATATVSVSTGQRESIAIAINQSLDEDD